jgi:hypothetical protein
MHLVVLKQRHQAVVKCPGTFVAPNPVRKTNKILYLQYEERVNHMNIRKNIGWPGRIGRIVAGVILLSFVPFGFLGAKTPLAFWGVLGIIPLIAGISGYCLPFDLLGINTYRKEKTVNQ